MLQQYAAGFYQVGLSLGVFDVAANQGEHALIGRLRGDALQRVIDSLKITRTWCVAVGLQTSVAGIDYVLALPEQQFKYKALKRIFGDLRRRIEDELSTVLLMHVPSQVAGYYDDAPLFGEAVALKFGDAVTDIQEAGKCFALARYTACVFHLMRVMEHSVQYLGKQLGVGLVEEKNWHNILDEVDKAIKNLPVGTGRQKGERNKFSQASAYLRMVKDAWRNDVMHPKGTYTGEEAERVFRNVKDFMVHLATKL